MGLDQRYPRIHADFLKLCRDAGQTRPTPLLLQYVPGDFNCLHQDLYGDLAFPLQVAILLSEPGRDFTGGEFVLTEQRPRMQSRVEVVPLRQGDAVALLSTTARFRARRATTASTCAMASAVSAPAAPYRRHHLPSSVFGPKLPSIAPGVVFHCPDAPLVSTRCRLRTTSPADPTFKVGIGLPSGRAAQVAGPTMPSTTKPAPSWNSLTAVSVFGPNTPSTARPRSGVRRKARCTLRTTSPVAPGAIVGCPGLGKGQSPIDQSIFYANRETSVAARSASTTTRNAKNYRRLEAHRRTHKPLHISPPRRVR